MHSPTSIFRAFVDYWIEASLSNCASTSSREVAIQPMEVRLPPLPLLALPPSIQRWHCQETVWTSRLPGMISQTRLPIHEQMRKVIRSARVPHYTFAVEVVCPKAIQLDSPSPIPLYVRTVPIASLSSDAVARAQRQTFRDGTTRRKRCAETRTSFVPSGHRLSARRYGCRQTRMRRRWMWGR